MDLYNRTAYQKAQIKVIDLIEDQINKNNVNFSTVSPSENYDTDERMCLTSVHFPDRGLLSQIREKIILPLKEVMPAHYYYENESLHLTIKNIRTISDPPNFSDLDISRAKEVFEEVLPKHNRFKVFFYRLLLFKSNLALVGTTDEELDRLVLDLDEGLKAKGVPDDKRYSNSRNFFCNMTLARFMSPLTGGYIDKIKKISEAIEIAPYTIDSVKLLTANAVLKKIRIYGNWLLG